MLSTHISYVDLISLTDLLVPNLCFFFGCQGSFSHLLAPPILSLIHHTAKKKIKKNHTLIFYWTAFSFDDGTMAILQ